MNKTFLGILVGLVLAAGVYVFAHPEAFKKNFASQEVKTATSTKSTDEKPAGKKSADAGEAKIDWSFTEETERDGIPYTKVTVNIDGAVYETGSFAGSCVQIGATGGVDGEGLLAGELSAVQCWFAGGGNEIGVFANEGGGYDILVGELGEGEEGGGFFRGNFEVKETIQF